MCFSRQRRAIFDFSSDHMTPKNRFNEPTFRLTRHTNHWKNTAFRDSSNIWRGCIFFLLTFAQLHLLSSDFTSSHLLFICFSTLHIVGSLLFKLPSTTFRASAIYPNFTEYCACHKKWPSKIPKCCAGHKKWHSKITKYCACHKKWHSKITKYCACHEKWCASLIVVTYETSFTMRGATGITLQPHQILRLPRKIALQNQRKICRKQLKRQFQCGDDSSMIRAWSDHDPSMNSSSRTRPFAEVTFRASETHFVLEITTFRVSAIYPNFTEYCACHKKWHSKIPKCRASHKKWHSRITKSLQDHQILRLPRKVRLLLNCYWTVTELLLNCYWTELLLNCSWTELLLNCYWTGTELLLNWPVTELFLNCYWTELLLNCYWTKLLLNWAVTELLLNCYWTELLLNWAVTELLLDCYWTDLLLDWDWTVTELLLNWAVDELSCYWTVTGLLLNWPVTGLWLNCYWTVTELSCWWTELLLNCYWTVTELTCYWTVTELLLNWPVTELLLSCYCSELLLLFLNLRNSEVSQLNFLWWCILNSLKCIPVCLSSQCTENSRIPLHVSCQDKKAAQEKRR